MYRWFESANDPLDVPARTPESELDEELWNRLVVCVMALWAGFLVAAYAIPAVPVPSLTGALIDALTMPAGIHLTRVRELEWIGVYSQVALRLMFVLAQPVILWQLLDWLAPTTVPNRLRRLRLAVTAIHASFLVGVVVFYGYLLPAMIQFLLMYASTGPNIILWAYTEYVELVTTFLFATGLLFEVPALMHGVVWLGIVSQERLAGWRKFAVVIALVLGGWITPGIDVLSQIVVPVPVYVTFELGLLLASMAPEPEKHAVAPVAPL